VDGAETSGGMIVSVLRIAVISLILVALVAGGVTLALAGSGRATAPITRAEADAFAHLVNLKATDLPGATALQGAIFGPEAVQYKAFQCGRRGNGVTTVGGGESWLSSGQGNVASIAAVAPNQQLAGAALALIGSRRGRICLARALGRALTFERHHTLEWSHAVKVTFVPVAKLLGGGAIAVHVLAKLPPIEEEHPLPKPKARYINSDAAFFRVGPAVVAFLVLGARLPLATEIRLLALLHSRAEAHKL
jgi:hypothetical protein